jgi:uncharacterized protein YegL
MSAVPDKPDAAADGQDGATTEPSDKEVLIERAREFIEQDVDSLGLLMGVSGISVTVGDGWSTNIKTGAVTVDPSFFVEEGYRPEWCSYAIMHEISAHLRELITDPEMSVKIHDFVGESRAKHLFHNIMSDIAGNKRIHSMLPAQANVAEQVYSEKLFAESDFRELPRHLQLMYKIIRQEMIPGSDTAVLPEVDEAIARLRHFGEGDVDIIEFSTRVNKTRTKAMEPGVKLNLWINHIYPEFEKLREQDIADPIQNQDNNEQGEGEGQGQGQDQDQADGESQGQGQQQGKGDGQEQSEGAGGTEDEGQEQGQGQDQADGEGQEQGQGHGESKGEGEGQGEDASGEGGGGGQAQEQGQGEDGFDKFYDDYERTKHASPISHEAQDEISKQIKEIKRQEAKAAAQNTPEAKARQALQDRIGAEHTPRTYRNYINTIRAHNAEIEQMQEFFGSLINERLKQRRTLNKPAPQGPILNPNTLAQTVIDLKAGVPQPPQAFLEHGIRVSEREAEGSYDCYLVVDDSGSMSGEKSGQARLAAMIFLEGLGAFERQIREQEQQEGIQLKWDVRTSVFTFGSSAHEVKPIGPELTDKSRLDVQKAISGGSGGTADYLALEAIASQIEDEILKDPSSKGRRRLVYVITDGESNDTSRLGAILKKLNSLEVEVVGIGIVDGSVEAVYPKGSKTIASAKDLPQTLIDSMEASMSR